MLDQFRMMLKINPHSAASYMGPRAKNYLVDWAAEPLPEHTETIAMWQSTWESLEVFEQNIMKEERWYQADMKRLIVQSQEKIDFQRRRCEIRIEALEQALLQIKMDSQLEIERLNM